MIGSWRYKLISKINMLIDTQAFSLRLFTSCSCFLQRISIGISCPPYIWYTNNHDSFEDKSLVSALLQFVSRLVKLNCKLSPLDIISFSRRPETVESIDRKYWLVSRLKYLNISYQTLQAFMRWELSFVFESTPERVQTVLIASGDIWEWQLLC